MTFADLQRARSPKIAKYAAVFAALLGLQAIWILVPELFRQPAVDPTTKQPATMHAGFPALAAQIAGLRGDLWADYALIKGTSALASSNNIGSSGAQDRFTEARSLAEHAVSLAPTDARLWLLLAELNSQSGQKADNTAALLKMSFYVAPNDGNLILNRLKLAMRLDVLSDDELQYLVEQQIRTIVLHKPEMKPELAATYRNASRPQQQFIEQKLGAIDPKLVAGLRAGTF